jgi:hypothetical protein
MTPEASLQTLALSGVAQQCAQQTDRFFRRLQYDPRYCFELFRRALLERNQQAYALLYQQYQALVAGWVERHPSFPALDEEVQYFVNRAFEKMWRALTPAKFERFPDLKSLLSYLKLCAGSAVLDYARAGRLEMADDEPGDLQIADTGAQIDPEQHTVSRVQQEEFWQLILTRLADERERLVVYGSFVLALKPRELSAKYPQVFADVNEIYRIKQNVLERLRRDAELRQNLAELR